LLGFGNAAAHLRIILLQYRHDFFLYYINYSDFENFTWSERFMYLK